MVRIIFSLFLMSIINLCFALPDDKDKVINLAADSADLNQETHKGSYIGNVKFDQGSTHLRAASALTKADKYNKLELALAKGSKEKQAHYWTETATDKPKLHAYADLIRYYPKKNLIELIGKARVAQGPNSFSAPKISYNTLTKQVLSTKTESARTEIIFYPEKKHD